MKEELFMDMTKGLIAIGAGLAVMTGMMTGLGEGTCAAHACDAIGKNPEAESKIRSTMILGIALSETCAIYGLLVSILLMFVYPNL
jgi:F-type H+-transporting ATPase subunit c